MPGLLGDAEGGQQVLEGVAAAAEAGGAGAPVVRERRRGQPVSVAGLQERVDDDLAGDRGVGAAAQQVAGMAVKPVNDLRAGPAGGGPVGEVGLPALVGLGGLEAPAGGAGPLRGSGVTWAAACRTRRIVAVDGTCSPACSRCQAIVTGPASQPAAVSSSRVLTMNSRTLSSVACGLLSGLRDRGSTASRPPSR
jgi:hypothetical protein